MVASFQEPGNSIPKLYIRINATPPPDTFPLILPKGYLLDCPQSVADGLKTHLKLYKLRSKVKIKDATATYDVLVSGVQDPWQAAAPAESGEGGDRSAAPDNAAAGEADAGADGRAARFADPRCAALGVRVIRPKGEAGMCARSSAAALGSYLEKRWTQGFCSGVFFSRSKEQGSGTMPCMRCATVYTQQTNIISCRVVFLSVDLGVLLDRVVDVLLRSLFWMRCWRLWRRLMRLV